MRHYSLVGGQLAYYEAPVAYRPEEMVSLSGGPLHGRVVLMERWVQGWGDYTVSPPTYYRRESPASTRFTYRDQP